MLKNNIIKLIYKFLIFFLFLYKSSLAKTGSSLFLEIGWLKVSYITSQTAIKEKYNGQGFEIGVKFIYDFPTTEFYISPHSYLVYTKNKLYQSYFIKVPIDFGYKIYQGKNYNFKVNTGPFFSYTVKTTNKLLEKWDYGLSLGIFITYKKKFTLDNQVEIGLKNLEKNILLKSRNLVIDIGYKIPL